MKRILKTIANLLFVIILAACSQSYGADEAIERGDVVDLHGTITNAEKLDQFILNIGKHAKDKVRITRYTIEGDPN